VNRIVNNVSAYPGLGGDAGMIKTENYNMVKKGKKHRNHKTVALVLSALPGVGQLYNRQFSKGFMLFFFTIVYIFVFLPIIVKGSRGGGIVGLFTLGINKFADNSLFFLVEGVVSAFLVLAGSALYLYNLIDAYRNGEKRDNGETLNLKNQHNAVMARGFPYLIMMPGMALMILAVVFPIIFTILMSLTNYNVNHMPPANLFDWIGLRNYFDILHMTQWRSTFMYTLSWTIIWTVSATMLTIVMGIATAIAINQKEIRLKRAWRTIMLLPWAIPFFISVLMFSSFFNDSFGAMNSQVVPFLDRILPFIKLTALPWKTHVGFARIALIMIQGWLGFPYVFVMVTSVLQSIPGDLYEAATIDGATRFEQFRKITLPWILSATAPVLITQFTFNFNNFNVIYLFNNGGPAVSGQLAGGTDLLVSWVYKITVESVAREYGIATAITVLVTSLVMIGAICSYTKTNAYKGGIEL
jgi:arabinogalactan oligomer/maltooligosaccharide transport system permease protein